MNGRFGVQLGVARPVDLRGRGSPDAEVDETPEESEPIVVVEYRNRGIPFYLIPPLLIVLAALGVMSYQNATPLPLRQPVPAQPAPGRAPARQADLRVALTSNVETADTDGALKPARPPESLPSAQPNGSAPASANRELNVVETSAAKPVSRGPAPSPVVKPITGASSLFELETTQGLRPVASAEPPLVPPASER